MFHRHVAAAALIMFFLPAGCGSDADSDPGGSSGASGSAGSAASGGTGGVGGTGGSGAGATGGQAGSGGTSDFDPEDPGIRMSFAIGVALMMGQPATFAAGAFLPTAREDLEQAPEPAEVPLETCQESSVTYTPACSGPQDCAPEQQCLPQTDMDGNAIPNSEICVTSRSPLDMGPFTVTGFATGPKTMAYNAQKNGGYTTVGGDGTIPYADLAFDTSYTFEGAGDTAQGLGAFTGEVRLGPEIKLTEPAMTALPIGFDGIQVSVSQDLVLQWTGSDPGAEMTITLTGGSMSGESHTITCRTIDTGTFTIPAAMVQAATLGDMAFLNMLSFERSDTGSVSGSGITSHDISTIQTAVINVAKLP